MKKFTHGILFISAFFLFSCVNLTVNVYFPTTEIKQAAEEIEERVRTGKGTDGLETSSLLQQKTDCLTYYVSLNFGGSVAYAQDEKVDIDIKTPVIKEIIESRTKRYKKIEPFMDSGVLGEGMKGYLQIRTSENMNLKELTQLKKLVNEENDDREKLYKEILLENELEMNKENLERVGKLFFSAIRKKMEVGHYYQVDKDKWKQKTKEEAERDKANN